MTGLADLADLADKLFRGGYPLPGFAEAAEAALQGLRPRDREVLLRRLAGESLADVAAAMGISRERVRQYEERAIRKLRPRLVHFIEIPPRPECLPLLEEDIEVLLEQAKREQREAWEAFRGSLSEAQRASWREYWRRRGDPGRAEVWEQFKCSLTKNQWELWRAYRRAGAYVRRVRQKMEKARAGEKIYEI